MRNKEMTKKSINEIMVLSETLPPDFYESPAWDKQLDQAIAVSENLVYSIDEEGEKQAKIDATNINKYVRTMDGFIATTYKIHTEKMQSWRDGKKAKTKKLLDNRQKIITQFDEARNKKLDEITKMLVSVLENTWTDLGVKKEFQNGNIQPLVSLTGTLTPKGALTKKATDFIDAIVAANLAEQRRIEARHMMIENRCLREDLNPPLTFAHMGESFAADDETFNAKLDFLILAEKERKIEMEERIKRQQAAENQRKIDEALRAQQAEANRIAREEAAKESAKLEENKRVIEEKTKAEQLRESAKRITEAAERAPTNAERQLNLKTAAVLRAEADKEEEKTKAEPGKKIVMITACFYITGPDSIENEAYVKRFMSILPAELKENCTIVDTQVRSDLNNEF